MRLLKAVTKKATYPFFPGFLSINVSGRFLVWPPGSRKRIKKYVFSNDNALLWAGDNKKKTLVRSKIFCFVLVKTETDTLKNALVWSVPSNCVIPHALNHVRDNSHNLFLIKTAVISVLAM